MSKNKTPNVYFNNTADVGVQSPAGKDEAGNNVDQFQAPKCNGVLLYNRSEYNLSRKATITSAQLLALNATAIEVIPAVGAGYAILINKVLIKHGTGTAYVVDAGDDLVLKYTDGSGAECSAIIETTGFLDQTTAQIRSVLGVATTPVANASVVLHLLNSEVTTGDFDLELLIDYNIVPTDL